MNKRHFEILKEMIIDFNEYSTDYTKTRCREIEQVLIDTLDYITNLQTIEQQYSAILSENAELDNKITNLQKENESLKQQNEYLRNDEYLKQVKWERDLNEKLVKDLQEKLEATKEENKRLAKEIQNVSLLQKVKDKLQNDYQEAVDKINELRIQLLATEKVSAEYIKRNDKAIEYNKKILKENWFGGYEKENATKNINILKGSDKE